jgi:hypothetical protein
MDKTLYQEWLESEDCFFKRVEELGGWPMDQAFVSIFHSINSKRPCEFGNQDLRTGWWTTIYSRDDYLWWKLSEPFKSELKAKHFQQFKQQIARMV